MSLLTNGVFSHTPLNTTDISQDELNIVNKSRRSHFQWNGQFSPQLIQSLLHTYAPSSHSVVFDPFVGSGTVLQEAGLLDMAACGTDINPAAVTFAQTYQFMNIHPQKRTLLLNQLKQTLLSHVTKPEMGISLQHMSKKLACLLLDIAHCMPDRFHNHVINTMIVLLDGHKASLSREKVVQMFNKLEKILLALPFSESTIHVYHADARQVPLPNATVDVVITSPPYINVFNYHQRYRTAMEALQWDVLKIAQSEFGANRKHRSNRFLTVIQYCLDIAQTFKEIERVCKPNSTIIFVVGRKSTVCKTSFYNGEIVSEIAHRALGYTLDMRQERVFTNRFGERIYEDILHFTLPSTSISHAVIAQARLIAHQVLKASLVLSPKPAQTDIFMAMENIEKIQPSPLFQVSSSFKQERETHYAPTTDTTQRKAACTCTEHQITHG